MDNGEVVREVKSSVEKLFDKIEEVHKTTNKIDIKIAKMEMADDIIKKEINDCQAFRKSSIKNTEDINKSMTEYCVKQGFIVKMLTLIGVTIMGVIGRLVYSFIHRN